MLDGDSCLITSVGLFITIATGRVSEVVLGSVPPPPKDPRLPDHPDLREAVYLCDQSFCCRWFLHQPAQTFALILPLWLLW